MIVTPSYAVDPVALLAHFDGANNGTTFTDSSSYRSTLTRNGTAVTSSAQVKFGDASLYLNGSSWLTSADSNLWRFTGDFTIEAWVYPLVFPSSTQVSTIVGHWPGVSATNCSFFFYYSTAGFPGFAWGIGTLNTNVTGTTQAVSLNAWNHIAVSRSGSTVRYFVNGNQDATTPTVSGPLNNSTAVLTIGRTNASDMHYVNGYVDELRITNGVALYTANFTPPTAPFD